MYEPGRGMDSYYKTYFKNQIGGSYISPYVYKGKRIMKGRGVGSVLSGLFKSVAPALKSGAKALGRKALETATDVAADLVDGKSFKQSARDRLRDSGRDLMGDVRMAIGRSGSRKQKRQMSFDDDDDDEDFMDAPLPKAPRRNTRRGKRPRGRARGSGKPRNVFY